MSFTLSIFQMSFLSWHGFAHVSVGFGPTFSTSEFNVKMVVIIIRSIKRTRKFCNCRIKICFSPWIFRGQLIHSSFSKQCNFIWFGARFFLLLYFSCRQSESKPENELMIFLNLFWINSKCFVSTTPECYSHWKHFGGIYQPNVETEIWSRNKNYFQVFGAIWLRLKLKRINRWIHLSTLCKSFWPLWNRFLIWEKKTFQYFVNAFRKLTLISFFL